MKRLTQILLKIFSVGVLACLFAGGLSAVGYIVALVIGGDAAVSLCGLIFTKYLPLVIKMTSIFTAVGLLGMYCSKQKALTVSAENVSKNS